MADLLADAELVGSSGAGAVLVDASVVSGYGRETGEPTPVGSMTHTAWFKWVAATTTGGAVFSTVGSAYDTVMAVYYHAAADPVDFAHLSLLASDDDSGGSGTSLVSVGVTAGETYYIQIGGWGTFTSNLRFNFPAGGGSGSAIALAADLTPHATLFGALVAEDASDLHAGLIHARATVTASLDADVDGPYGLRARVVAKATVAPDVTVVRHRTLLLLVTTGRSVDNSLEVELESHLGKNARLESVPDPTRTSTASFA